MQILRIHISNACQKLERIILGKIESHRAQPIYWEERERKFHSTIFYLLSRAAH